jgi:hypothetical protein
MPGGTDAGDIPGDVTWMSYAELGRSRGISPASAKRLSNRRRWPKRAGNDGTTRVAVPATEAVVRETDAGGTSGDVPGDMSRLLAEANTRADEAHRRADVAVALADRTLVQLAEAHTENGKLRDRLDQARAEAAEARQQAEALRQAEAERAGKGRWARLRAAWRGDANAKRAGAG